MVNGMGPAADPGNVARIQAAMDGPWVNIALFWGLLVLALAGDGCYRLLRKAGILAGATIGSSSARAAQRVPGGVEQAGLRVLLAIAAVPWLCIISDFAGVPITRLSLTLWGIALFVAGLALEGRNPLRHPQGSGMRNPRAPEAIGSGTRSAFRQTPMMSLLRSPAVLLLALAGASLVAFSVVHIRYAPERSYDALVGFDLVGKVMAFEGKLRSTVFTRIAFNAQCTYAPLTATNDGFWYLFDAAVPRLWMPLLTAGFLLAVWPRLREWTGSPTAAGLATFVMFLPSSFAYQLTEAQTDMPSMAFTAMAVFSAVDLLRRREGYGPAALFLFAATTARSENILFGAALTLLVVLWRLPGRWRSLWFTALPAAFFVFWNLLVVKGMIGYDPGEQFRRSIDFDPGRMAEVLRRAFTIMAEPAFFGEFIWMMAALPLLWFLGRWRRTRDRFLPRALGADGRDVVAGDTTGTLLLILGLFFVVYVPFFYMWDPVLIPLWTMEHTFKRGFLRFIPGLTAAFVCSPPVLWALRKCDGA